MAQITIVLRRDPASGKQNIVVKLDSDADALPIEHERLHRQLVEQLLGQGLAVESLGELIVEREAIPATIAEGAGDRRQPRAERGAS